MDITLFDHNADLVSAWRCEFSDCANMCISECDLAALPRHDAIVTPGNSFGVMTGGLDLAVRDMFGIGLQDAIQNHILNYAETIPVGAAYAVGIAGDAPRGMVIYSPTMYTPRPAHPLNICHATTAALYSAHVNGAHSVAIPGLGAGAGGLSPEDAARAMRAGYEAFLRLTHA